MAKEIKEYDQLSADAQPGHSIAEQSASLPANPSRRNFGKMQGAVSAVSTVTLTGCGGSGGDSAPAVTPVAPGTQTLTRAAFVATVSDYFNWPHSSEYIDRFASV